MHEFSKLFYTLYNLIKIDKIDNFYWFYLFNCFFFLLLLPLLLGGTSTRLGVSCAPPRVVFSLFTGHKLCCKRGAGGKEESRMSLYIEVILGGILIFTFLKANRKSVISFLVHNDLNKRTRFILEECVPP
jgi:hypothetical protein